jgi:hypothetical protein
MSIDNTAHKLSKIGKSMNYSNGRTISIMMIILSIGEHLARVHHRMQTRVNHSLIVEFSIRLNFSFVCLDGSVRYRTTRDVDERTNSSLTESRHVSMQGNVPTIGSLRVLPMLDDEASFEQSYTSARSRFDSEPNKVIEH